MWELIDTTHFGGDRWYPASYASSLEIGVDPGDVAELAYVMQDGPLQNLNLKWRNSSLRRDWTGSKSFDENRLIISYPMSLL